MMKHLFQSVAQIRELKPVKRSLATRNMEEFHVCLHFLRLLYHTAGEMRVVFKKTNKQQPYQHSRLHWHPTHVEGCEVALSLHLRNLNGSYLWKRIPYRRMGV